MLEQHKVMKHKRINFNMPNSRKLKVLTPEEISRYSSMLYENLRQQMPSLVESKDKLLDHEIGPFPLQYHQGANENCTNNTDHHIEFSESTTEAYDTNISSQQNEYYIQNTMKKENIFSAVHELATMHKTPKYQAFKKRILNNYTVQTTHLGVSAAKSSDMDVESTNIIQINSDSEDESDTGKSLELNQRLPVDQAERRRKNKEAAKRCRMRKKMLQNEVAVRAIFLAQENYELRRELDALKYKMTLHKEN